MDKNEKDELLKKYGISLRQLPRISVSDSVIKILNGTSGDVVKITRKSPVAGETVYYRVVVKG